ncbi:MAG: hypothetical protein ABFD63_13945 [Smithella sp.]|jgi:hypothetical protein
MKKNVVYILLMLIVCVTGASAQTRTTPPPAKVTVSEDGSEVISKVQRPTSLQLLSHVELTAAGRPAFRPDVTAIGGELWLAYNSPGGPMLLRLDSNLSKLGPALQLRAATERVTDLRVGNAAGQFWKAYESALMPEQTCNEHFLNVALYTVSPFQSSQGVLHIAKGCALNKQFIEHPRELPAYPEITDDPTPFYHKGIHYILTRAWGEKGTVHHLRKLNADLSVSEDIVLDTRKMVPEGNMMSQSALLHINGKPFLVAGFQTGMWIPPNKSSLYIIPLNDDLRSFSGKAIRLPVTNVTFPTRVTRARHVNGTLIINFNDSFVGPTGFKVSEYLALFDINAGFTLLGQIRTQDHKVMDNHSSFEILDDRLYLFQQQDGEKISVKIFQLKSK